MHFDQKLGHRTCEIRKMPCECTQFTSTLDKHWIPGVPPHQQPCYKPVKTVTY